MNDIKLSEGEVICPLCKGSGVNPEYEGYICCKCNGNGKVDWVTNATNRKIQFSSLSMAQLLIKNTRKKLNNNMFNNRGDVAEYIDSYLEELRTNQLVSNYSVNCVDKENILITMQPTKTLEKIEINYTVIVN